MIRHRCFPNFIINLLSALAAFSFFDKKFSINTVEEIVHPSFLTVAYIELTLNQLQKHFGWIMGIYARPILMSFDGFI